MNAIDSERPSSLGAADSWTATEVGTFFAPEVPADAPAGLEACWVADGRLLAGAHPAIGPYPLGQRLEVLIDAGVRHFIDLTGIGELGDYEAVLARRAAARGVEVSYARLPLPARGVPSDSLRMTTVLDRLERCLESTGITYVHGRDPMRRPGMVVGCLLVRRGQSGTVALDWLDTRHWRNGGRLETRPLTAEQKTFVSLWGQRS